MSTPATGPTFTASAAPYRAAGWTGTFPLPHGAKYPPPSGFTGAAGRTPTADDLAAWDRPTPSNIALHLPATVLGIDVDHYASKRGGDTLAALEAALGPLPVTVRSTSRDDGVSGIRPFRIPAGRAWTAMGPGIDLVHTAHRYVVAAPSLHPAGGTYRWLDADGRETALPAEADLPELPAAWVERFGAHESATRPAVHDVDVAAWLAEHDGDPCADVLDVLVRFEADLTDGSSRYDSMLRAQMRLAGAGHRGCPGAAVALETLRAAYATSTAGESRDPREFDRGLRGALSKLDPADTEHTCSAGLTLTDPADLSLWDERPVLRHLHDFARGRMAAPLAVLGVTLARVVTATPSNVVLPAIVGGVGTPNLIVGLVGPSGAGKGAATDAAFDAIDMSGVTDSRSGDPVFRANVGTGEGLLKAYADRRSAGKGEPLELVRIRDSVLFNVAEVDTLSSLTSRAGSTIMPMIRSAWSGEALGFLNASSERNLFVEPRSYRFAMTVGIQPGRADAILDDADGGTPQRFLWLPVTDSDMPDETPPCPDPLTFTIPRAWTAVPGYQRVMQVCDTAQQTIRAARLASSRGQEDALDGHGLYSRLKVAAALALLDQRLDVTDDDWRIAGRIMAASDRCRADVVARRRSANRESHLKQAKAEAERAVIVHDELRAAAVKRAARSIRRELAKNPTEGAARSTLRRALAGRDRDTFDEAVTALITTGDVHADEHTHHGQLATTYRLKERAA